MRLTRFAQYVRTAKSRRAFAIFAWAALVWNVLVIVWGAFVRVSFSGDGCGANWPTCNGRFVPNELSAPVVIEYTHRLMTSVDAIATVAMLAWAFLAFPKKHPVRRTSVWTGVLLAVEALLGAGLVLFRYVAKDQSAGRVFYLCAHLTNTMLLLAALTITAWLAYSGIDRIRLASTSHAARGALLVALIVSVTGAIAALGDTLFPAASLSAGVQQDLSSASSLLLRLRMLHPLLAVGGAAYLVGVAAAELRKSGARSTRTAARRVIAVVALQFVVGVTNLWLLAPAWNQLTHLFMADLVWIAVLLLAFEGARASPVFEGGPSALPGREVPA